MTSTCNHEIISDNDICITGIAIIAPKAKNMAEFEYNIYNKVDMLESVEENGRYKTSNKTELPPRGGFIDGIEYFDEQFFGIHRKQVTMMDPQGRLTIEKAYEAIADAGINPRSLRGANIGVFIGMSHSESEVYNMGEHTDDIEFGLLGSVRSMLANRISYVLDLKGPSLVVDTACSSSLYAIDIAFQSILNGRCDAALVGATSLLITTAGTERFQKLGVLSADGYSRPFDEKANGYVRAETVSVAFLQKAKDSKRIYAKLIYSNTNSDGYKNEGITYPSGELQQTLLNKFYREINVDPSTVSYVEAHATGTYVGDPIECEVLDNIFCKNRRKPLIIGGVKGNIGHSEASSGMGALAKLLLVTDRMEIAPNLFYRSPRNGVKGFSEKRLQICTEVTPLEGPLVAISSFGFGGSNAHALLSINPKAKKHRDIHSDSLPRLVLWASRTEEGVNKVFDQISEHPLDNEFIGLLHNFQKIEEPGFMYRGYGLFGAQMKDKTVCIEKSVQMISNGKGPIIFMFSGMGSQWNGMGKSLLQLPIFKSSIEKCHNVLQSVGVDLITIITGQFHIQVTWERSLTCKIANLRIIFYGRKSYLSSISKHFEGNIRNLLCLIRRPFPGYTFSIFTWNGPTTDDPEIFDSVLHSFVGIAAIQIGITDVLKELGILPDHIIGHSVGEVVCGYADGALTLEETILVAYHRGKATLSANVVKGAMAAVGLGYRKLLQVVPPSIEVVCHNSSTSSTISGPEKDVHDFVGKLEKDKIFARVVSSSGIPYHSRYIKSVGKRYLQQVASVLKNPKKRSAKWISSSVPKSEYNDTEHQYASASYFTNNLLHHVLFEEACEELPRNGCMIEIAPHGLMQAIVKKSLPTLQHIPTTSRVHSNNLFYFLCSLGRLYVNGVPICAEKLYPKIEFPVSRGTQKISSLITWRHVEKWFVPHWGAMEYKSAQCRITVSTNTKYGDFSGHQIDGRCLLPATGYLYMVWEQFSFMHSLSQHEVDIEFEDVRFMRATTLTQSKDVMLDILVHYGTGKFEISAKAAPVVTGIIRQVPSKIPLTELPPLPRNSPPLLSDRDFYKELKIRGYQYHGDFQSVTEVRADGLSGNIKWTNNWVSFMDCLLQINILAKDSRSLYLPTRIRKLRINPKTHLESVDLTDSSISVQSCPELEVIQAGGIEIIGMSANAVSRRNNPGNLVRESYEFCSYNFTNTISTNDAIRVCAQLAIENGLSLKVRALEIKDAKMEPIISNVFNVLMKIPQITFELYLLTNDNVDIKNVTLFNGKLAEQTNCSFVISTECLMDRKLLLEIGNSLINNGFIICREKVSINYKDPNFNIIATIKTEDEYFILLQKIDKSKLQVPPRVIQIKTADAQFTWIKNLNEAIKDSPVLLVAEHDIYSGLLGLVNCLRKEPKYNSVRLMYIDDVQAPKFDMNNSFYSQQLSLGLAVNILKNGEWGSYRHLELFQNSTEKPRIDHYYASLLRKGDLSSFNWLKGPLNPQKVKNIARVQYASLNFKDVMLATGKLSAEEAYKNRFNSENLVGFEFSGISCDGHRVMGMSRPGALSTFAEYRENITFKVPDSMSMEEAATIPTVYLTVYYAFFMHNPISSGKSILIHAGSGGIGLAAIRVALAYNMEVFTTVSNEVKKKFILEQFPSLKESHIGNSRDCAFERMVKLITRGKGVDFVLNSLSEEKLKASIRCLGHHGTFLEIGKFDMANNNEIGLESFLKELTFRSIMADHFDLLELAHQKRIRNLIEKDLKNGIIQPLPATIFHVNEVEKAFRYLSTGKHVGKVIIKVRSDPFDKFSVPIKALPRCYFDADKVYILLGGLGGFGLELTDWMILRGARKIVLISRRGVSSGYQEHRIRLWKSYGCQIIISTNDTTTLMGCQAVLKESTKYGQIDGIFNLAAVLRDGTMETQTPQSFIECLTPKATATKYLDHLSRKECPRLTYFVVFSSISCGQGNAGQSNYGMANSVMERIIERRVADGLSGKAIQWGAIGEVGLVAQMTNGRLDVEIAGTMQQPISSCLTELDILLCTPNPIVLCMITAEKTMQLKIAKSTSIIDSVMNIMGIPDTKSIPFGVSLSDLGMDSLMVTEILQTLERDFDVILESSELRSLTLTKLNEISTKCTSAVKNEIKAAAKDERYRLFDFKYMFEENSYNNQDLFYRISSLNNDDEFSSCLVLLPGIDGVTMDWRNLASKLHLPTFIVNIMQTTKPFDSIVNTLTEKVKTVFKRQKYFYLVAHSFGSLLAIEIARKLEAIGMTGHIIFIDGSPTIAKKVAIGFLGCDSNEDIKLPLCALFVHEINPDENVEKFSIKLKQLPTFEEQLVEIMNYAKMVNYHLSSNSHNIGVGLYRCLTAIMAYTNNAPKIHSSVTLLRAKSPVFASMKENYDLDIYAEGEIRVIYLDGNHLTILTNNLIANIIKEEDPFK